MGAGGGKEQPAGGLEINAAPGFFPVAVAGRFGAFGTAVFFGALGRRVGFGQRIGRRGGQRQWLRIRLVHYGFSLFWMQEWRWSTVPVPRLEGTPGSGGKRAIAAVRPRWVMGRYYAVHTL